MSWLWFVTWNLILPAGLGAVAVVSPLPINFGALALWVALLVVSSRKQRQHCRSMLVTGSLITNVIVFAGIGIAAHLAPLKTIDRFLERTITVPQLSMTLAELEGDPNGPQPDWRPFSVHMSVPTDERENVIEFSDTTLTLREFVMAIESQSTLRHRFGHCGNGYTILEGGDCSFGLRLRRP